MDRLESSAAGASIVSAILSALSLLNGFAPIAAVLAAFAGAMVTISFNSYLQKRLWKREVVIKMVGELYGPLFVENGRILQALMEKELYLSLRTMNGEWSRILADYHYLVLPLPLRAQLDNFYALASQVDQESSELNAVISKILLKDTGSVIGAEVGMASWSLQLYVGEQVLAMHPFDLHETIVKGWTPSDVYTKSVPAIYPTATSFKVFADAQKVGESEVFKQEVKTETADNLFRKMVEELHSDQKYKNFAKDKLELGAVGGSIREQLKVIVSEPWKVQ